MKIIVESIGVFLFIFFIVLVPSFAVYSFVTYTPEPLQQSEEEFSIIRVFKNGKYYSFQTIDENKKIIDHYFYDLEIFADVEQDKPMWAKVIKQFNSKYEISKRAEVHIHEPEEITGGSYTDRVHKNNKIRNTNVIE